MMDLRDFVKLVRNRWITVCVTTLVAFAGAVVYTVVQTPLYQGSTRLFVSTAAGTTMQDVYSGNRLSQERVLSYVELLTGETLAQRTIDRLNLNIDANTLRERITAKSKPTTVLIDLSVLDESPVRARDIANALSDEFVSMARELETPTPGAQPAARVIVEQRATLPTSPKIPRKKLNLAAGLVLGLILGMGLATLREQLDNTVKGQEDVEDLTGTSVVGFIPFDKKLQQSPEISYDVDTSGAAEAFRKLRTNLQFLAVDHPPRLIVVTSSSPGEGKSTTAINIALALAEGEHSVVLVDGDLRRPRLAKYLDLMGSVGFSTVLSGGAELKEVLQETRFSRLSVLASGPIPPNPSELLGSMAAKNVLAELRETFDFVIIDSAPLLAVTDGAILAAEADGALMAVRAGSTKREHLEHAIGMLRDVGATVLGAVFTMMPTRRSGPYSYNYHYNYGGRRREQSSKP